MITPEERQARKEKKAAGKRTGNLGYLIRLINAGDEAKIAAFSAKCGIPVEEAKARMAAKKKLLAEGAISGGAASGADGVEAGPPAVAVPVPSDLSKEMAIAQAAKEILGDVSYATPEIARALTHAATVIAEERYLTAYEEAMLTERPALETVPANATETLVAEGAPALQAQAPDSEFVNGWPKETTATIWNFVPNPLLINIKLEDGRYVSCWNIDRILAPNDRVRVRCVKWDGAVCFEITEILPRPR